MNKALILKYKKEFDYWLSGGGLLVKYATLNKVNNKNSWYAESNIYSQNLWNQELSKIASVIVDDEYVELRKALAEGKTVQYNPILVYHNRWDTIESINPSEKDSIRNYRINQDKSKRNTTMNTNELNQKIANMEAELAEMKALLNEPIQEINYWQPDASNADYWYVSHSGAVLCSTLNPKNDESLRYRVFKTEAEAKKYAEYIKAEETLRKAIAEVNKGWLPNWNDKSESKYGIDYISMTNTLTVTHNQEYKYRPTFMYIKSKDDAKDIINTYEKELKTYLSY